MGPRKVIGRRVVGSGCAERRGAAKAAVETLESRQLLDASALSAVVQEEAVAGPALATPVAAASTGISIPDANLMAAIRWELGKDTGAITSADMASLTSLTLAQANIRDLTGLQYAVNLETLDLESNLVSDLTPLSGLTSLQTLNLYCNRVRDVRPLAGLTQLESLTLSNNLVSDVSPLSGLTSLSSLDIYDNQISDVTPLSGLTQLQSLSVSSNQISDVTALSDLVSLQSLDLSSNPITDVTALAGMAQLTSLYLLDNQITDITPLSGLTQLTWLDLSNPISDLTPLSGLTQLTDLFLDSNQISDVAPLSALTQLNLLILNNNQISDVTPLAGLTQLSWLELSDNQIVDVTPLAGLTQLWVLNLSNNQIRDVTPLSGLASSPLKSLYLSHNDISDVTALAGLTLLDDLSVDGNHISDVTPLAGLTQLTRLDLAINQISDLTPLAGLTHLGSLRLDHNQVSDLTPLAGLTQLSDLYLACNQISDLTPLEGKVPWDVAYNNLDISPGSTSMDIIQSWIGGEDGGMDVSFMPQGTSGVVTFGDANLEAAVRLALAGIAGDITDRDLYALRSLDAGNAGIVDLSGLEYAINLETLSLDGNQISDVAPLAGLSRLTELGLDNNQISDVTPLAELDALLNLSVRGNQISNLAPLAALTQLAEADVRYNSIDLTTGTPSMDVIEQWVGQEAGVKYLPQSGDASVLRGGFGLVGGKTVSLPLQDTDGDVVTFALTGGGSGRVYGHGGAFEGIVLTGTNAKSTLTISIKKGAGGDGQVMIGNLSSDGLLKSIKASGVVLCGQVRLNTLNKAPGKSSVSIQFQQFVDASVEAQNLPIASLKLLDWQDTDAIPDLLKALSIGSITISGRKENLKTAASEYLPGDLDALITVGRGIGSIKVAGSITGTIRSGSDAKGIGIRSLTAGGYVVGATIMTTGSIGKISAAELLGSDILIGVASDFAGRFAGHDDFINSAAKLGSLTVTGTKLPKGSSYGAYVSGVHVSAPSIGMLKLANVDGTAGAVQVHVLADTGVLTITALNPVMDGVSVLTAGSWKAGKAGRPGIFDGV